MARGAALAPFDTADVGGLESSAAAMAAQAARAIDAERLTMQAFMPAVQNWDGIAAAQLRAAPEPVRQSAYEISDKLAWAATALRYWASQVQAFNDRVMQILAELSTAKLQIFSATDAKGDPLPLGDMLDAARAVDAVARKDWHDAYDSYIVAGGRTAASMFTSGPTGPNVFAARSVGLLPPGDWGPLGPYPWLAGRVELGAGAGLTMYRYLREPRWADARPWRIPGTGPYYAAGPGSLLGRAATGLQASGGAISVLDSLSRRMRHGAGLHEAAPAAVTEALSSGACAKKAAGFVAQRTGPLVTPHQALAKGGGVILAGVGGAVVCSGPAQKRATWSKTSSPRSRWR